MPVTFDPSMVADPDRDWIRFKLDDIVETDTSIEDDTIDAILTRAEGNLILALLSCGQSLYIKLLKKADDLTLGSQKIGYKRRAENLKVMLDDWTENGVPDLPGSQPIGMAAGLIGEPDLTTYESLI